MITVLTVDAALRRICAIFREQADRGDITPTERDLLIMAPFCSPFTSTTWPRMTASARTPAGQNGRYPNQLGGTNDTRPRQPPELTHRPSATQRMAQSCGEVSCSRAGRPEISTLPSLLLPSHRTTTERTDDSGMSAQRTESVRTVMDGPGRCAHYYGLERLPHRRLSCRAARVQVRPQVGDDQLKRDLPDAGSGLGRASDKLPKLADGLDNPCQAAIKVEVPPQEPGHASAAARPGRR